MSPLRHPHPSLRDESGFVVSGLIVRFIIVLSLLALAGYEATQVLIAQIKAESVSRAAATAGADSYYRFKRADVAERDAVAAARKIDPNAKITSFAVANDGSVIVEASKRANTLLMYRMGFFKKYNVQKATDQEKRLQ
jgi:hypothetical protein